MILFKLHSSSVIRILSPRFTGRVLHATQMADISWLSKVANVEPAGLARLVLRHSPQTDIVLAMK
jgi:hypothetical protein